MAGKVLLNGRVHQYGFVHAMPAGVLTVAFLLDGLPAWIARRGGDGRLLRGIALAVLAAWGCRAEAFSLHWYAGKSVPVGSGSDAFLADARGTVVHGILAAAGDRIGPGRTLAAVPEGVMINYLLRRRNPTRCVSIMPTELTVFGEERVFRDHVEHPPDFLLLVHKDSQGDFGVRFFGIDYAREYRPWVDANYRLVSTSGAPPFRGPTFGIQLLERRPGPR